MALSRIFQDVSQAIKAGSFRLARIDVFELGFLAQRDLSSVELPVQCAPQKVAVLRKETASIQLSLEVEIDQFHLQDEGVPERFVELLDSETKFDRFSTAHHPKLVVTQVYSSSEGEEEGMDLKQRISLRGLMASRNKGQTLKEALKAQVTSALPPLPPSLPTDLELKAIPDLRKKRSNEDLEEGEVGLQKGAKQ